MQIFSVTLILVLAVEDIGRSYAADQIISPHGATRRHLSSFVPPPCVNEISDFSVSPSTRGPNRENTFTFEMKFDNLRDCFVECRGHFIVHVKDSGRCYCWTERDCKPHGHCESGECPGQPDGLWEPEKGVVVYDQTACYREEKCNDQSFIDDDDNDRGHWSQSDECVRTIPGFGISPAMRGPTTEDTYTFWSRFDNLSECFRECPKHYIVHSRSSGRCFCWLERSCQPSGYCSSGNCPVHSKHGIAGQYEAENGVDVYDQTPCYREDRCENDEHKHDDDDDNYQVDTSAHSYDRKYTRLQGERCEVSSSIGIIRDAACDLNGFDNCREFCSAECDKEEDCLAFRHGSFEGSACTLYRQCNYVMSDGCDYCTVSVCLENCPEGTPAYYVRHVGQGKNCAADNLVETVQTPRWCSMFEQCPFKFCAEQCREKEECTEFRVSSNYQKCELYTLCNLDYNDDDDGNVATGFVGYFRQPRTCSWSALSSWEPRECLRKDRDDPDREFQYAPQGFGCLAEDSDVVLNDGDTWDDRPTGDEYTYSRDSSFWYCAHTVAARGFSRAIVTYDTKTGECRVGCKPENMQCLPEVISGKSCSEVSS